MTTFGALKDQVIGELHGHTLDMPAQGTLLAPITASSLELAIDFGDQLGAARPNGLIEVGNELLYVSQWDQANSRATIPPWGRAQRGTVAAEHDADVPVTVRPRYPRKRVGDTLNQVLAASCPPLFAVRDLAPFDTDAFVDLGYALPADLIRVLRVEGTELGPEFLVDRQLQRNWTVRDVAGTKLLELDRGAIFRTMQVTVAARPTLLVNDADEFTASGLPESCADMALFGAVSRLILGAELARQQATTVEAAQRGTNLPSGSSTTLSRYFLGLYTQRLEAERNRLQDLYPIKLLRRG